MHSGMPQGIVLMREWEDLGCAPCKVAPYSIYEHPRYRPRVRKANLVNLSSNFPSRDFTSDRYNFLKTIYIS